MDLNEFREELDRLDSDLLRTLAERFDLSGEIAKYKKNHNLPTRDPEREKALIRDRTKKLSDLGFKDENFVSDLFELILKKSRDLQEQARK